MKSPWVTPVAVLIVGLGLGAALVGRPTTPTNDIRILAVPPSTTAVSTTLARPLTPATPTPAATTTTQLVATITPTSAVTASLAAPITESPATTAETITTTPGPDRSIVLVLVANAGNASGIARAEAARLSALGYPTPRTADANERLKQTTVYARAGHEDAALVLLADAGLPADRLRPFPGQRFPLTSLDARADLILALGNDWQA